MSTVKDYSAHFEFEFEGAKFAIVVYDETGFYGLLELDENGEMVRGGKLHTDEDYIPNNAVRHGLNLLIAAAKKAFA